MAEDFEIAEAILRAIRRIVRAVDVQSRQLAGSYGLTGPQLVTLRAIQRLGPTSVSTVAREVSLGKATITGILDRLERPGLVERVRDKSDRRRVTVRVTPDGAEALKGAPPVLHDRFLRELSGLEGWEQSSMLATLERVASMMERGAGGGDFSAEPEAARPEETGSRPADGDGAEERRGARA